MPQIKDYSELKEMDIPNMGEELKTIKEQLADARKQIEDDLKIPSDIFTGNGNRWELSSKYEEYTNTLNHFLKTVSDSICRFCVSIAYRLTGKYYDISLFTHKFDLNKYISPYMKSSRVSSLNDKIGELTSLIDSVKTAMDNKAVDQTKFIDYINKELGEADPSLKGVLKLIPASFLDVENQEGIEENIENNSPFVKDEDEDIISTPSNDYGEEFLEPEEENENETEDEDLIESDFIDDIGEAIL